MFGTANLTNCTLTTNTAQGGDSGLIGGGGGSGFGAAILNLDGQLALTFCTVANNTVAGGAGSPKGISDGGAVYNLAFGNAFGGGAQTATATITDSILSNMTGGVDLSNNAVDVNLININTATVTLSGPNLVVTSNGSIGGAMPLTTDPQLGSLQNNGGLTSTLAIPINSPAVQAGTPVAGVTTDQRGLLRPGAPSLGAFEALPAPPPSSSPPPSTPGAATPAPMGPLTAFALGFGPGFQLDVFEVDSQGHVFAQGFSLSGPTSSPAYLSDTLQLLAAAFNNGELMALLPSSNQLSVFAFFNFSNHFVDQALLGNPLIEAMLVASLNQ
jgi:hypothetical protein